MVKKRVPKASKHRLLFFGTLSIFIIIYFLFSVTYYTMDIYKLQKEEKELKNTLNSLKYDEKGLKTEIEKLKDPDYLARYARENYLYSKNGEIVIKLQKEEKIEQKMQEKKDYRFIFFGGCLILLFIIGYVIKKNKQVKKNYKRA